MKSQREVELEAELTAIRESRKSAKQKEMEAERAKAEREREDRLRREEEARKPNEAKLEAFLAELQELLAKYDHDIFIEGGDADDVVVRIGSGVLCVERRLP